MINRAAILATVVCTSFASAATISGLDAGIRGLYFEVEPNGTIAEAIANNHVGTYTYPGDGTSIEGVGIIPDLEVAWTLEDFRQERDPDLAAAERLLLEELSRLN